MKIIDDYKLIEGSELLISIVSNNSYYLVKF